MIVLTHLLYYILYFLILFSVLNKMSNKKLYTAEEAARWILEEIPNDLSGEVESSGSDDDDDFVPDALGFSNPIADK